VFRSVQEFSWGFRSDLVRSCQELSGVVFCDMFRQSRSQQARPFWAMLETLQKSLPRAAILENVEGLERRGVDLDGRKVTCLEYILHLIRTRCPEYIVVVVPPAMTDPIAAGAYIRRPREYILAFRRDVYTQLSDDNAGGMVLSLVSRINEASRLTTRAVGRPQSFLNTLEHSAANRGEHIPCGCSLFRDCGNLHMCPCAECREGRTCIWRKRHQAGWARVGASGGVGYLELMGQRGIQASIDLESPRQRNLVELTVAKCGRGDVDSIINGVLDVSQSFGHHQWRSDGTLPTLGTNSKMFSVGLGRCLDIVDLYRLMGFPPVYDLASRPYNVSVKLLGNSMHVGTVGTMLTVMMALRIGQH
jgi:hypothetical protein